MGERSLLPGVVGDEPLSQALTKQYIKLHAHNDWFLCLAWAIIEEAHGTSKEEFQGFMLAKAYTFLRDCIPAGLRPGSQWAHIRGSEVMEHLLCRIGESSTSRHKITRTAITAFDNLEKWMKHGEDWQQALEKNEELGVTTRRVSVSKAPGLHSPAGLMALVAVSYPDTKLRGRIERLGIEWMILPRATLHVQEGFWRGITAKNLYSCFQREEARSAEVELLTDYTMLFGAMFTTARKNMVPYLPQPFAHLRLTEEPANAGLNAAEELAQHLHSSAGTPGELEEWLRGQLEQNPRPVQTMWYRHWTGRMDNAAIFDSQLIIRSLFLQSLRTVRSLWAAQLPGIGSPQMVVDAYMLLDIEDAGLKERSSDSDDFAQDLSHLSPYEAFKTVCQGLCDDAEAGGHRPVLERLVAEQTVYFHELCRHKTLLSHMASVIMLDTLRMQGLLCWNPDGGRHPSVAADVSDVLRQSTATSLELTKWQLRQLTLSRTDPKYILTNEQTRVRVGHVFPNLTRVEPQRITSPGGDTELGAVMRSLFGELSATSRPEQASPGRKASRDARVADVVHVAPNSRSQSTAGSVHCGRASVDGLSANGDSASTRGSAQAMRQLFNGRKSGPVKRTASGTPKEGSGWNASKEDIREMVKEEGNMLRRELESISAEQKVQLEDFRDQLTDRMDSLASSIELNTAAAEEQKDLLKMLGTKVEDLNGLVASLLQPKASLPPQLGEDGYLGVECLAPAGWEQDKYSKTLVRAAWYYIHEATDSDEGVEVDEDAIDATTAKFPDLEFDHIVTAIKHVCAQTYPRPFRLEEQDGTE